MTLAFTQKILEIIRGSYLVVVSLWREAINQAQGAHMDANIKNTCRHADNLRKCQQRFTMSVSKLQKRQQHDIDSGSYINLQSHKALTNLTNDKNCVSFTAIM